MNGPRHQLRRSLCMVLAGNADLVRRKYLVIEELGDGRPRRSTGLDWKGNSSKDVLHEEKVRMAVGSTDHGVVGGLWHNPVSSCGSGQEGSVVRILHYGQTSC